MTRAEERLAALGAGGELSRRGDQRLGLARERERVIGELADALAAQRERTLADQRRPAAGEDVERTVRALRARIAEAERPSHGMARWWIPAGVVGVACAIVLWIGAEWVRQELTLPVAPPAVVAVLPEALVLAPPRVPKRLDRPAVAAAAARPAKGAPVRPTGAPSMAQTLQAAMDRVEEIVETEGGSYRLKLKTRNPNVVIYLVQGEAPQSGEQEDINGVGGER